VLFHILKEWPMLKSNILFEIHQKKVVFYGIVVIIHNTFNYKCIMKQNSEKSDARSLASLLKKYMTNFASFFIYFNFKKFK
jgi:hypothetical protein